jgi:predicted acylesterase/phospholipase RssA
MSPMNLQIAFQGGGARLALLIPVIEALQQLEKDKEINVTRIAGTSAGAIAAALLAGNGNIPALVEHLRRITRNDATLKKAFPPVGNLTPWEQLKLLKTIFWNKSSIGDETSLSTLIGDALEAANIWLGNLRCPEYLTAL